jgi:plasmid maintenance system antidote protein VapI
MGKKHIDGKRPNARMKISIDMNMRIKRVFSNGLLVWVRTICKISQINLKVS